MSNSFLALSSQSLNAFEFLPENLIENWSFHLPLGFPIFFFLGFPIFFFLRQGYMHVTLITFPPFILSTFQLFFVVKYIRSLVLSFLRFVICLLKFTWDLVSQCLFLLYHSFSWHKFSFQKQINGLNTKYVTVVKFSFHFVSEIIALYIFIVTPCMLSSYSIITPTTAHI